MEWYCRNLFLHSNYTAIREVLIQPPNEKTTTPATLTVQRAHRRHFLHEERHFVEKEKKKKKKKSNLRLQNTVITKRGWWYRSMKYHRGLTRYFPWSYYTQIQPLRIHDIAIPTRHVCLAVARYRCTPARLWIKSVGNWPACWQVGFI